MHTQFWSGKFKVRSQVGDLDIDGRLSNWFFENQLMKVGNGLNWFKIRFNSGLLCTWQQFLKWRKLISWLSDLTHQLHSQESSTKTMWKEVCTTWRWGWYYSRKTIILCILVCTKDNFCYLHFSYFPLYFNPS